MGRLTPSKVNSEVENRISKVPLRDISAQILLADKRREDVAGEFVATDVFVGGNSAALALFRQGTGCGSA